MRALDFLCELLPEDTTVEILTHALVSLALVRAGRKLLPRYGAAMVVVAGVAADLDFLSYLRGPSAFLRFHRAVSVSYTHLDVYKRQQYQRVLY